MAHASTTPCTGEGPEPSPQTTGVEIVEAIGKTDAAFQSWQKARYAERAQVMRQAAVFSRSGAKSMEASRVA